MGVGVPPDQYTLKTNNFQLKIDFFLTILGFQGRIFLNLHIIFFGHGVKKKLGFSQLLGGGGQD